MSDAESSSNTRRFFLVVILGFVALCASSLAGQLERMNNETVIKDVELFLKASRLQTLILPEQQEIIDEITKSWKNSSYLGPIRPIKVKDWIKQHGGTLSP